MPSAAGIARRRIFVNVTRTYFQGSRSGIPRVVRRTAQALAEQPDLELICFIFHAGHFYEIPIMAFAASNRTAGVLREAYRMSGLRRLRQRRVEATVSKIWQSISALRIAARGGRGGLQRLAAFAPGDTIVLLDCDNSEAFFAALADAKGSANVVAIVYDLFLLQYAQDYDAGEVARFAQYLARLVALSDQLIGISRRTRDAVINYLSQAGVVKPVSYYHLGADLGGAPAVPPKPRTGIPLLLSVSALEPRKNYAFALRICDLLWERGIAFRYVIVGERTPRSGDIEGAIHRHPRFGKELIYAGGASDAQLLALYGRADFLLSTSIDEGFGIPVMEACYNGVAVICSDIPVYRETCPPDAVFIPLDDAAEAARRIEIALQDDAVSRAPAPGLRTWKQSADWLLAEIGAGL